ncbi:MAG: DNA polymerase Y family protein [Chitinophagaceae bacterium]|nr:MAG: DNA polymerase Y family protein [Chitinophagaceae bacterium]
MTKRYVAIWFRHLVADWTVRRQPELKNIPFVLATPEHGRMVVKAVNRLAHANGIHNGMVVADCRAILPGLQVMDDQPGQAQKILKSLGLWCIRYTPIAAVDGEDGLILDASGCAHLWGGEQAYLDDILARLRALGYDVRAAMASTIGTAWAVSRYGKMVPIIPPGQQLQALLSLPPGALRLDATIIERLEKLGLSPIERFIHMPRTVLRRRFGSTILQRLDQALGQGIEIIESIQPAEPYHERLPSLDPIHTATGIQVAIQQLLEKLCQRLSKEGLGLRGAVFKCYRADGKTEQVGIGTNRPSRNVQHLFKLFELKIPSITPGPGIELFILDAPKVETLSPGQEALWDNASSHDSKEIAELIDRVAGKIGSHCIERYLPSEHYWPERAAKLASSLDETPLSNWRKDLPRPVHLLSHPEQIEVSVPLPDYPPMLFTYKGTRHKIKKADGPERIEQEWWLEQGLYRDYYCVEDDTGARYWLFRLGSYDDGQPKWFLHGFFA